MNDPVAALALLWRAAVDPDGAAINRPSDLEVARDLIDNGMGELVSREAKPHQAVLLEEGQTLVAYFMLNNPGRLRWESVLRLVAAPHFAGAGFERYVEGRVHGLR